MTSTLIAKHPTEFYPQLRAAPGRIELHTANGVGVVSVDAIFVQAISGVQDEPKGPALISIGAERIVRWSFSTWQILEAVDKARDLQREGAQPNERLIEIERAARSAESGIAIILRVFRSNFRVEE